MSSSLSICRTLNLREKSFPVPRSSETATAGSVAASGLVRLRKIFLPIKFSCPTFRGSAPMASTHPIPSARPSTARPTSTIFPINKTADRGQEDCMGRNISQPPAGRTRIRQSFRLKAGLRTRKIRLVSLRKIFLPTKFSCPTFRGSGPIRPHTREYENRVERANCRAAPNERSSSRFSFFWRSMCAMRSP